MRIPVFARGANPRVDRPILKKSTFYGAEQVQNLLADWVDPSDHSRGIIAREFLPSAKRVETVEVSAVNWAELPGIRYVPPPMEENPTLPRLNLQALSEVVPTWDWSQEAVDCSMSCK